MWLVFGLFWILLSCSLAPGNLQVRSVDDLRSRHIKRIALLAVDSAAVDSAVPRKGVDKSAGALVTDFLYASMQQSPHWQVVSEREVQETGGTITSPTPTQARRLGELIYADAVLLGRVLRFRERVGEDLGVQSPASVAFALQLVDVRRGDVIWSAEYQETQKALSENLLAIGDFTRRGGKWVKAEDLAREGAHKAVEQLNHMLYR